MTRFSLTVLAIPAVVVMCILIGAPCMAGDIPLIDAHSQLAKGLNPDIIIPLMDRAGVRHTILSARNDRKPQDVLRLARAHPLRLSAAVRTKGKAFNNNTSGYYTLLNTQLAQLDFTAMAEVLLFHAQKGKKAPEISVSPDAPQVQSALNACLQRGWPFIAHIEFAGATAKRQRFMDGLEDLLHRHPQHPFVLIHMGQLGPNEAARLLDTYANLHFITSHCNPITDAKSSQPWTVIHEGKSIAPAWQALMIRHSDRFILAFDNVWPEHWGSYYLRQAAWWQAALAQLPPHVAHAIAHRNAERLWHLEPQN